MNTTKPNNNIRVNLNFEERRWLDQHGGRDESDVFLSEDSEKYVFMTNGYKEDVRVFLPEYPVDKVVKN